MAGGRPPKPTNLLSIHGGLRKDRHADRDREPQPEGSAFDVAGLSGQALMAWEHLAPRLMGLGLATELDSHELTAMCEWWGEYRKWCDMPQDINDYRRMTGMAAAYKQFRTIAAKFGLTPTDRVGLQGARPNDQDELADLIA